MSGTVPVTGEPGPLLAKLAVDVFHEPTGLPAALPVRVYCQSGDLNPLRPGRQAPGQRRRKVVPNADVTDQPTGTNQDPCPVEDLAVGPRGDAFRAARRLVRAARRCSNWPRRRRRAGWPCRHRSQAAAPADRSLRGSYGRLGAGPPRSSTAHGHRSSVHRWPVGTPAAHR